MATTTHFNPDLYPGGRHLRPTSVFNNYLRNREYGFRPRLGDESRLQRELYSSICPIAKWEYQDDGYCDSYVEDVGGIHSMAFSPDGDVLAAACEHRSITFFDPLTQKRVSTLTNAHFKSVIGVQFLTSDIFASCSNDGSMTLWDVRNLKDCYKLLHGEGYWVRNITYSREDRLLVTGGADGRVIMWDMNLFSERGGIIRNVVWNVSGLSGITLVPNSNKLLLSTTEGLIILINDLNLGTLASDLNEFKPELYRFIQVYDKRIPHVTKYTPLFYSKRNRVEFITDFPKYDNAEVITSIHVHPQGWNLLSRNIGTNRKNEWTCVHDIQEIDPSLRINEFEDANLDGAKKWKRSVVDNSMESGCRKPARLSRINVDETIKDINSLSPRKTRLQILRTHDHEIHKNARRLTHYIMESNAGKGLVKEPCYSRDGRIICSPFGAGIRLLSFSPNCDELSTLDPKLPAVKLHKLAVNVSHSDIVLCTQSSPTHTLFVSGCAGGRIVWYQPRN